MATLFFQVMYMYYLLGFRLWGDFGETVKRFTGENQQENKNGAFSGNNWLERRTRLRSQRRRGSSDPTAIFEDLKEGILEQVRSNVCPKIILWQTQKACLERIQCQMSNFQNPSGQISNFQKMIMSKFRCQCQNLKKIS